MSTATAALHPSCARCGGFITSARDVFYSQSGAKVCPACHEREDLEDSARREANTVRAGGYTGPFLVLASFPASLVFGIFGVLMMVLGVFISGSALLTMVRDHELRGRLGFHATITMGLSGLATLLGGGFLALMFLGVGALAVLR